MSNKKYKLIIFDCDGTLVDSEPITNALIAEMICEKGIQITQAECLELFAGKTLLHITDYLRSHGCQQDDAEFENEYRDRCLKLFKAELQPIAGVPELLTDLKIPFCVASNGPMVKMNVTLPAAGLMDHFDKSNMFSAYDINKWKPSPELFLYAASKMNTDPKDCLVIEDTWSGVMGAINARIDVFAFNAHDDRRTFIHQVPNFSSMNSIKDLICNHI